MAKFTSYMPALTVRSFLACLFGMLATGMLIQVTHVYLSAGSPGEFAFAIPALWVFGFILVLFTVAYGLSRARILTRPELLCVFYAMVLCAPMMTQGFWHRVLAITSTIPRTGDFGKLDAYSDKFWPQGANLFTVETDGTPLVAVDLDEGVTTAIQPYLNDREGEVFVINNTVGGESMGIRYTVPVKQEPGDIGIMPGTPYLISLLVKPESLGGVSSYFARVYLDDNTTPSEIFQSRRVRSPTVVNLTGFQREGTYGFVVPEEARQSVTFEFGLQDTGLIYLTDPRIQSVLTLEQAFTGRVLVSEEEFAALEPHLRHGVLVRPDTLLSWAGIKFLLAGYVPWGEWLTPLFTWGSLLALVLLGTLALMVIMRRKWMDGERFSMPLTQIPVSLIGRDEDGPFSSIWRNRMMWYGFGVSFFWCVLRAMQFYNPNLPDLNIAIPLGSYFGQEWGQMWNITFSVVAIFLAVAVFIELNVLFSLVVGFFLFRMLFWVGYLGGMDTTPGYPFPEEQQAGAFLAYAVCILFFARKYLKGVVLEALGRRPASTEEPEIISYRSAFILLIAVFIGAYVWSRWTEVSPVGMMVFLVCLLAIGLVSARLRAECGIPWGYFTPGNAALFILLAGGIGAFGANTVVFAFVTSFFITVSVFFLIPGAQLEFMELGRRYKINPRHILYTCVLGIVGGVVIGGWVFLSLSYSQGGESLRYAWAFDHKAWYFGNLNVEINQSTRAALDDSITHTGPWSGQSIWGYAYGAGGTTLFTILRQLFAGFWFHPVGFMLGSTHMMNISGGNLWGSFLVAWIIRLLVVKIGGAETVRKKLLPFFVGFFIAAVLVWLLILIHGAYLRAQGVELIFTNLL